MIAHPRADPAVVTWVNDLLATAHRLVVPEIADYEVRRELLRANLQPSVGRLDVLKRTLEYLPLTTDAMLQAAAFWAQARQAGMPTAPDPALDGDVILAAQAAILARSGPDPVMIATTNVGHLSRFAPAHLWHSIRP
jgi:hypothetical protein